MAALLLSAPWSSAAQTVQDVPIGYFGPSDGDMWQAAQLTVEQANAAGGFRGKPFQLVSAWSQDPWGTGVSKLVRLVYQRRVWAIVGGIDGPSTHLAAQVVAKARLTLVSPVSTDRTTNLANVPWVFSLAPGDHLTAGPLAAEIERRGAKGKKGLVLLSADDHDSRVFTAELRKALAKRRVGVQHQFEFRRDAKRTSRLVERVVSAGPSAVVIAAGPADSARLLDGLRAGGYSGGIFGGPAMGRRSVARAADAAGGVVFPLLYDPSSPSEAGKEFREAFQRRYKKMPDYTAAHTHDALRLLIAAIRKAGLNRTHIRDAVRDLAPWTGVTGIVRWDRRGSNTRTPPLGTIDDGCLRAIPKPRTHRAALELPSVMRRNWSTRTFFKTSTPPRLPGPKCSRMP